MFHNSLRQWRQQAGFLIPLALFLLVGIAFLAIAIARISGQTGSQATLEGISVQAFFAAESGAQYGMHQLLFNASSRTQADNRCDAFSGGNTVTFSAPGLGLCRAIVSCSRTTDTANTTSFYRVNSQGQCGDGQLLGEREIEVSAFMQ